MKKLSLIVSLVDRNNDYQRAQAAAAEDAASRLVGVDVQVLFAAGDAVEQSQQLSAVIQSKTKRVSGIVLQPVGTGMQQLARAATSTGIAWASCTNPLITSQTSDAVRGPPIRTQHRPRGGGKNPAKTGSCLASRRGHGLGHSWTPDRLHSEQRLNGLKSAIPANTRLPTVRGKWTEQSGYEAAAAWFRLSTSKQEPIALVLSQNDLMARGASKAFTEIATGNTKERFTKLPLVGCDGLPDSGQLWVKQGFLTATVVLPALAGTAIEMLTSAIRNNGQPQELTIINAISYPQIDQLVAIGSRANPTHP